MKITIVGGGTAGWIAAYFLCNDQPGDHEITVVESSSIGIIGAGEGSTGTMIDLLNGTFFNKSVDFDKFLQETDGTLKQGIYHHNWTGDGTGYFAPIDASPTWYYFEDTHFKCALANFKKEKFHLASHIGIDYEYGLNKNFGAMHFDGHKVGKFFKKECVSQGVKLIDDVVSNIVCKDNGYVDYIEFDSGNKIKADLFIDCTGFARVIAKEVDIKWESYAEYLPVNSAIPFQLKYKNGEVPKTYTSATALSAGWMWEIPLQTRKGCGYVYDDRFITKDQALAELENVVGEEIEPIKHIKFESGRSEVFWKKNVLVLGLTSAFVEPLEATSIHSTIIQLLIFSKEYLFKDTLQTDKDGSRLEYNKKILMLYDNILDFISYHYQGQRRDSEFWNYIHNEKIVTPRAYHFLEKSKIKIPGFLEINGTIGSPSVALWNWISAGMDIITPEQAEEELNRLNKSTIELQYQQFINSYLAEKKYIKYI